MAALEEDRSMRMGDELPMNTKRMSIPLSTEGYAMPGDYVDVDAVASAEGRAALLDSSLDGDESVDLDSSGSDREVTNAEDRALKKRYRRLMDAEAREFVPAGKVIAVS